jgi:hypothetical protein
MSRITNDFGSGGRVHKLFEDIHNSSNPSCNGGGYEICVYSNESIFKDFGRSGNLSKHVSPMAIKERLGGNHSMCFSLEAYQKINNSRFWGNLLIV